ncbi:Mbov_0395 family pilin-like conjugal transfer protein [Mycoplasma mycoides]|uniref:Mbov_0395 family pilin-like conjugal transfer protein n=1 Tax=Mycoplasma mycoides TaxID=2102 RepID=UPI00223F165C|nr:integrative conjugal element protein [Mycoplasma mycoides]QVK09454.1 integrative conjugal element protein [Mycoplasma mycoides subsp. capri]
MNWLLHLNSIIFAAGIDDKLVENNLIQIANKVLKYISIVLGSFAGVLVILICIIAAYAWFKGAKSDNEQQRAAYFTKIKLLFGFFLFVIVMWAIAGFVVLILHAVWSKPIDLNTATAIIPSLLGV